MPYITIGDRVDIDDALRKFLNLMGPLTPGQFVYIMYQIAGWQASGGGVGNLPVGWTEASRVVADMECAKLEFYRRIVVPYEEEKIYENGDCRPIRGNTQQYKSSTNSMPLHSSRRTAEDDEEGEY